MSNRLSLFTKLPFEFFVGCEDDPEGTGGAEGSGETQTGGGSEGSESTGGDPQKKIAALEEEKNRHFTARQKAEQEREELLAWKKEQEDKGKSEQERTASKLKELETQNQELIAELQQLRVKTAFLSTNTVEWHEPETALALVDLSEVQIDKDGNVDKDKLKSAIEALSKAKPYLVKQQAQEQTKQPPASGAAPKAKQVKGTTDEELFRKYPALRSHRR